jgi:two-component system chemotaxis response regulator CheY
MYAGKVLVVDDSSTIRETVRCILELFGFAVIEANNGRDALRKLNSDPLALIITDYSMPEMNGLELIQVLKHHPSQSKVPVIMLTAEDKVKQQALHAGASGWLTKPFGYEALTTLVCKMTTEAAAC